MTIRAAILRASLALVLGSILLSGAMSFHEFRESLQAEIALNLRASANALLERIDAFLFERVQDLREWHQLELLQDIRVGDVDKRLARLLSDLRAGYGEVYDVLFCTDPEGHIVAASDGTLIGEVHGPRPALVREALEGSVPVELESLPRVGGLPAAGLTLRVDVPDAFAGGRLGYLYAILNWDEVKRLLNESIRDSGRTALLLDAEGHVIAASHPSPVEGLQEDLTLTDWYRGASGPLPKTRDGSTLGADRLLLGAAVSSGYQHFSGFGWHLLMVEPTSIAFAPVRRLAWAMLGALLTTLALAGWFSVRLSARIARPIAELTHFARRLRETKAPAAPAIDTRFAEVEELSRAFGEMLEALERSRSHLVRAAKLAVVGEMAAIMAHEVRTPLGILKSSAQLLERRPDLPPQDRELIAFISSETDRLNRLVTTLLECAAPHPPHFLAHDLHEILLHVLALIASKAEKKEVRLETHLAASGPLLSCDREQLVQVFLNLVINAMQFAPQGGRVAVSTSEQNGELTACIEDDGPGVPEANRDRVFDPFFTRREGGIGLGLTVVQQIVRAHEGEIEVTTSRWGGACFNVRLRTEAGRTQR